MSPTCRALSFRGRKHLLSGVWWPGNKACCGCYGLSDCPPVLIQEPSVQEPERRDESEGWSLSQPGQPVGGGTTAPALDGKALVSCPLPPPQHSHRPSSQNSTEAPPIGSRLGLGFSHPPKFKDDKISTGAAAPTAVAQLAAGGGTSCSFVLRS